MAAENSKLIVLAAGGTGGHVFPAEALAGELLARGYELALLTDRRGVKWGGALERVAVHSLRAGGIAGRGLKAKAKAILDLGLGVLQAKALLETLRPAAAVGFGGYASIPGVTAALWRGVPTLVHEQNAVLGRANRRLAAKAKRVATAFAEVRYLPKDAAVIQVGMPVRAPIRALRDAPAPTLGESGPIEVLVLGGSQGATVFSQVIPAALKALPDDIRARLRVSQQARPADLDAAEAAYAGSGLDVTLRSFFDDVPERLGRAHLVISRSGASTVAELTTAGRPAILVPYPHAIDDHQTANAQAVAETGGAWLMPQDVFTPEALAARLENLFAQPRALEAAAAAARSAGRDDAAERLADAVVAMLPKETAR